MKPASQICRDAAKLIRERGHAKGNYESNDGRLCLVGALCYAGIGSDSSRIYEAIEGVSGVPSPATWNDAPERTPAEVIAALEKAASKLEAAP